jgi:uncharacterized membrane protein YphA (DoxX/SURF4 family)
MDDMSKHFTRNEWALVPLRLMVGFGFAAHGYAKLSRGPANFASVLTSLHVPQPHLMAWITSLLEFSEASASWQEHSSFCSASLWPS